MLLIQIENGQPTGNPVQVENFRQLFPLVSFPAYLTPADVEPHGFGLYDYSDVLTPGRYEKLVETTPVRNESGIWKQTFTLVPMTEAERTAADEQKAQEVRGERTFRMQASDWTQVPDAKVDKAAWATYRQTLRDVPNQEGFPWEVDWGTEPSISPVS